MFYLKRSFKISVGGASSEAGASRINVALAKGIWYVASFRGLTCTCAACFVILLLLLLVLLLNTLAAYILWVASLSTGLRNVSPLMLLLLFLAKLRSFWVASLSRGLRNVSGLNVFCSSSRSYDFSEEASPRRLCFVTFRCPLWSASLISEGLLSEKLVFHLILIWFYSQAAKGCFS